MYTTKQQMREERQSERERGGLKHHGEAKSEPGPTAPYDGPKDSYDGWSETLHKFNLLTKRF